jgi:hypothetical protein
LIVFVFIPVRDVRAIEPEEPITMRFAEPIDPDTMPFAEPDDDVVDPGTATIRFAEPVTTPVCDPV